MLKVRPLKKNELFGDSYEPPPPKKLVCKWSLNSIPQHEISAMGEAVDRMIDQIAAGVIIDMLKDGMPLEVALAGYGWEEIERIMKNNDKLRKYISDPKNNGDIVEWIEKQVKDGN